jgi:hypothetical protein
MTHTQTSEGLTAERRIQVIPLPADELDPGDGTGGGDFEACCCCCCSCNYGGE